MFRPQIKVVDCTVRDGGLMNKWQFEDDFVEQVYLANTRAGIDYMEIGYLSSESAFSRDEYGPWKFCAEKDIQRIIGHNGEKKIKLSAMADIGRIEYEDIPNCEESSLDMIRVACYIHQIDAAVDLVIRCGGAAVLADVEFAGPDGGVGTGRALGHFCAVLEQAKGLAVVRANQVDPAAGLRLPAVAVDAAYVPAPCLAQTLEEPAALVPLAAAQQHRRS